MLEDNAYACIEVADTGCGIPDRDVERIFEPFFTHKFVGRGLGLAVVLGIVRAHHGAVTLESKPNQGTVFRVLCDLTMPHMDGWATLTALRKLAPGMPVILASGYSEAQAMQGDHAELPQAFLSKPYEFAALSDAIARFMLKK